MKKLINFRLETHQFLVFLAHELELFVIFHDISLQFLVIFHKVLKKH